MPSKNRGFVTELLSAIRSAKVYDLEQTRFQEMPVFPLSKPGYFYGLNLRHKDNYQKEGRRKTGAAGLVVMADHTGTHIDALCHIALDLRLFDGTEIDNSVETPGGYAKHGAETIPPLITRGILLDIAGAKGKTLLPPQYAITVEDLTECLAAENAEINEGDVLLVRTGLGRFWRDADRYHQDAGIAPEASRWLAEQKVSAVGADNLAWDLVDQIEPETGELRVGHRELIAKKGIYILENLYLEELAEDRRYEFVFVGLPPKLKGATASPIRPIAIVNP